MQASSGCSAAMTRPRPQTGDCASASGEGVARRLGAAGDQPQARRLRPCPRRSGHAPGPSTPPQPSRRAAAKSGDRPERHHVHVGTSHARPEDTRSRLRASRPGVWCPGKELLDRGAPRFGELAGGHERSTRGLSSPIARPRPRPARPGESKINQRPGSDGRRVYGRRAPAVAASRPIRSTSRAAVRPPAAPASRATRAAGARLPSSRAPVPARRSGRMSPTARLPSKEVSEASAQSGPLRSRRNTAIVERHRHVGVDALAGAGQDRPEQLEPAVEQARMNVILVGPVGLAGGPQLGQGLLRVRSSGRRSQENVGPGSRPDLRRASFRHCGVAGLAGEPRADRPPGRRPRSRRPLAPSMRPTACVVNVGSPSPSAGRQRSTMRNAARLRALGREDRLDGLGRLVQQQRLHQRHVADAPGLAVQGGRRRPGPFPGRRRRA